VNKYTDIHGRSQKVDTKGIQTGLVWWYTFINPATQEMEIRRIAIQGSWLKS
jgi:hypothetical protein